MAFLHGPRGRFVPGANIDIDVGFASLTAFVIRLYSILPIWPFSVDDAIIRLRHQTVFFGLESAGKPFDDPAIRGYSPVAGTRRMV